MRDTNFQIGDLVSIRDWDDMVNEFGMRPRGGINCRFIFTEEMIELCGKEFIITEIENGKIYGLNDSRYSISKDMIEFVKGFDDIEETEELNDFLLGVKIK